MAEIDPLRAFGLLQGADLGGEASRELGQDQSLVQGPPRLGELLEGRFRLLRPLGQGGMGTVFLGRDEEELEREVAIKVLSTGGEGPRQRFMREAEVTARLSHPHVIRIHGSGQVRGHPYLVYELVPGGKSLEDAFRTAPLEQRLDLVAQVAAGLAAAHQAGVVHRDLKPENVLIRPDGTAVVADFGLAGLDESSLTRTGQTMGTPAYMAPEQVRGESATPACDVWALGLLLYEALYEEHALLDEGSGLQALLARIYEARVELPRGGPPALRRLLEQTLVADPAERPPDAAAFARALTEARGSSGGRRGLIAGLGLAGVALIAALAVSLWPGKSEPKPSPTATAVAAASPPAEAKPSPEADSSKQEFPQPLTHVRWAAFVGEERLALGDTKCLVVCDLEGRVQRRLPGNFFLIRQGPAGLWLSDEAGAHWLRASDLELDELVTGRILDCDPDRREILVRTEEGVEIRDAGGGLVRALAPRERLKIQAGFLLSERVVLSIWKPRTFCLVANRGDPSSVLREDGRLGDRVRRIAISPDRTRIGIGTGAGWVLFGSADLQTLDPLSRQRKGGGFKNVSIQAHNNKVADLVLRGDLLLSFSRPSDDPGDAVLWDLRTRKPAAIRDAKRIRAVALSPAGRVAIVSPDSVEVMRLEDFE